MRETIVIYRLGSLGDTIVALPCFNAIREKYPTARKVLLTNRPVSSKAAPIEAVLGSGTGFFDDVIAYPVELRSPKALLRLWRQLRSLQSTTVIYLTPPRGMLRVLRDWLFFRLAGFNQVLGMPLRAEHANCRVRNGMQEAEASRLARCLANVKKIDLESRDAWDLRLEDREIVAGDLVLGPLVSEKFIVVNTGGKAAEKDWGLDNWRALLTRLGAQVSGVGLLFVGAAEDRDRAHTLASVWPGATVNACGLLSPRESGAAMRGAILFAGHDSGPLHLASAVGVPCVALFGSFNRPARWHPHGSHHTVIHEMRGVDKISVEAVLGAILKALGGEAVR